MKTKKDECADGCPRGCQHDQAVKKFPTHTPGPWTIKWGPSETAKYPDGSLREAIAYRVGAAPDRPEIYREDLRDNALTVAECGENEANARLIAAAPELLEALRGLLNVIADSQTFDPRVATARAAIAKAEGR